MIESTSVGLAGGLLAPMFVQLPDETFAGQLPPTRHISMPCWVSVVLVDVAVVKTATIPPRVTVVVPTDISTTAVEDVGGMPPPPAELTVTVCGAV